MRISVEREGRKGKGVARGGVSATLIFRNWKHGWNSQVVIAGGAFLATVEGERSLWQP